MREKLWSLGAGRLLSLARAAFVMVALCFCASSKADTIIWYVDADCAATTPTGQSWAEAFIDIQSAIDAAVDDGASSVSLAEVWVAAGSYTAITSPVVRMKERVHLYGGFATTETLRNERDWHSNVTVIDGQRARRCVEGADDATLDGFTIRNGWHPIWGGGMFIAGCSPTVANCVFADNESSGVAGAIFCSGAPSLTITNCVFTGNRVLHGDTVTLNWCRSPTLTNCTFYGNSSGWGVGVGLYIGSSSPVVTKCIFWDDSGAQIHSDYSSTPTVTHSCVRGGYPDGTDIIDSDPMFVDADNGDLRLLPSSPCIDAGTMVGAPSADIRGVTRPLGLGVDMGVYEFEGHTLSYTARWGGVIDGPTPQRLFTGEDGVPVRAAPRPGYAFEQWSDGFLNHTRQDTNVTTDIIVQAIFFSTLPPASAVWDWRKY